MEIRRSARTSASFGGRQGFVQAQQLDFSPITQGLDQTRETVDLLRRERQSFELQKRLLEENNNLEADLEARRRDPNIDPLTFSQTADTDYTARVNAVTEEFRKQGFDPDLVDDFAIGMTRVRNQLTDKATTYQLSALNQRAVVQVGNLLDEASRQVVIDPDGYEDYVGYIEDTIDLNPDLTDEDRIRAKDALRPTLSKAGAESLAMERPDFILEQLDPEGRWRTDRQQRAAASASGSIVAEGAPAEVGQVLSAGGLPPAVVAGFLGNFEVEGGYGGTQGDGGTASGIAQWRNERRDNFRKQYGKEPHEGSVQEQAAFVLWEMNNPAAAGMSVAQRDQILAASTPEQAAELIDKFYERSDGKHRSRRTKAATTFMGINDDLVDVGVSQAADIQAVDPGQSSATQDEFSQVRDLPPVPKELHPVLRDLTGPERLQFLRVAYEKTRQAESNNRAEMDLRLDIIRTQIDTNGGVSDPFPTLEEMIPVYGEIGAQQKMAEIETLQGRAVMMRDWQTSSIEDIDRDVEALRPSQSDPALPTKMKIFQDAAEVRDKIIEQRLADPASYAISTNPRLAEAINEGDPFSYYKLQRAEQERLGIPARNRNPWPKEYIEEQKTAYGRLPIEQRYDWMLRHMRGATPDEFANFANAFEGTSAYDDALVANMLYNTLPTAKFEKTLPLALQGAEAIRKDPARRPPSEKMLTAFQDNLLAGVRNINPNFSRSIQNAAAAIYVARAGEIAEPDPRLYQESLREALGGQFNVPGTGWGSFGKNGVRDLTILPAGVRESTFEDWLYSLTDDSLASLSLNGQAQYATGEPVRARDIAEEGVLVMIEPGVYTVKFQQSQGVTEGAYGADGRPLRLRIRAKDVVAPARQRGSSMQQTKRNAF